MAEHYREMVKTDPKDVNAWCALGRAYLEMGDHARALKSYSMAVQLRPTMFNANMGLGLTYLATEQKLQALKFIERAMGFDCSDMDAFDTLINLCREMGLEKLVKKYSDAKCVAQKKRDIIETKLNREKAGKLFFEAKRQMGSKRYKDANRLLREVVELDPENAEAVYLHGVCSENVGDYQNALRLFERGATIEPDRKPSCAHRSGICLYKLGRLEDAVDMLKQAKDLGVAEKELFLTAALVLVRLGDHENAIVWVKEGIISTNDQELALMLGKLYEENGRMDEAAEVYKDIIKHDSKNAEAHLRLGIYYAKIKNYEKCMVKCRELLALNKAMAEELKEYF